MWLIENGIGVKTLCHTWEQVSEQIQFHRSGRFIVEFVNVVERKEVSPEVTFNLETGKVEKIKHFDPTPLSRTASEEDLDD